MKKEIWKRETKEIIEIMAGQRCPACFITQSKEGLYGKNT